MASTVEAGVRARFIAGAEELGVVGAELAGLGTVFDAGDCPATQARLAEVARLQAAAVRLAEPSTAGACGEGCTCVTAASTRTAPRMPVARAALPLLDNSVGTDLVCTLDGGLDSMRGRIGEWQAVIGRAVGREAADGGVTLVYDHDPAVAVELARLGAAEFACCSFFGFTLTVAPAGMRFTVTAPAEAATLVTAVFGKAAG